MRRLAPLLLAAPLAALAPPSAQRALQADLAALVRDWGIPGASLAVVLPDGRVLKAAAGFADPERGRPMRPDHRLFTGSIGKTYVAGVVLQLAAEGCLDLDDSLSKHLGDAPWFRRLPNSDRITLRHLLTHTAGLPEYVEKEAVWVEALAHPDRTWTPEARLDHILGDAPRFEPGRGFGYADTHYILLGMVVERVTGRRFEAELQARLLGPLGLRESLPADRRDLPDLPVGHSSLPPLFHMPPKVVVEGRYVINPQLEWTGGGLCSTAADLARWGHALYGGRVLSEPWLRRMVTPCGVPTDFPEGADYGLGAILWKTKLGPAWGHSGFVPGFNAVLQHLPEQRVTLALLCNADSALKGPGRSPHQAAQRLLAGVVARLGKGGGAR